MSSRPAWTASRDPISKTKQNTIENTLYKNVIKITLDFFFIGSINQGKYRKYFVLEL